MPSSMLPRKFGALAVTAEFRHRTMTQAALITPRRTPLLAAKLATLTVLGFAFGLVTTGAATAVALERTTLMSWASEEVELQIINEPRLGMALMQYFIREVLELQDRVEAMARYNIPERVLLALLHFATRLGSTEPDGRLRMSPLTHQTIAEYVGTSREVVTFQMNRLRQLGVIRYSRRYIAVDVAAAHASLREVGSQAQRRTALRNAQTGGSST